MTTDESTKSANLIGHIKFLLWKQLDGCSVTRPFLSLERVWLARLIFCQLQNFLYTCTFINVPRPLSFEFCEMITCTYAYIQLVVLLIVCVPRSSSEYSLWYTHMCSHDRRPISSGLKGLGPSYFSLGRLLVLIWWLVTFMFSNLDIVGYSATV